MHTINPDAIKKNKQQPYSKLNSNNLIIIQFKLTIKAGS